MSRAPDAIPPLSADEYRRRARRLRATFAGDSAKLQAALRELAARRNAAATATGGAACEGGDGAPFVDPIDSAGGYEGPASPVAGGAARLFAARIASSFDGTTLRYSRRRVLLREAADLGIGRFEATLLIAAVQHRHLASRPARPPRARASAGRRPLIPYRLALTACALQAGIGSAVWWIVSA